MEYGRIKIQTLNLWHHPIEHVNRLRGVVKRIQLERPDIIALQEVVFWADGTTSADYIASETGMRVVAAHAQPTNAPDPTGTISGNAILADPKMFVGENGYAPLIPNLERSVNASVVWFWTFTPYGNPLLVLTTHLSWGVLNEYQRLQEAIDVNAITKDLIKDVPNALTVLTGTFNSTPDSDTIRFLTGKMAVADAKNFWIDCWNETEEGATGETQTPRNLWMRVMAAENGTADTTRLPKRRVDYIFVRDWVYGQTGSPINTKIAFAEPIGVGAYPEAPVSDHFGVEALLLDIPMNKH